VYDDLGRPPLSERALRSGLVREGSLWRELRVVPETASTNADVAAEARAGAAEGLVVVAEHQSGGRGRRGRVWSSPPRAGLTYSVLLRPDRVPPARWGWLPLLAGLALARAVERLGEVEAVLKWPNDLLVGPERGKAAGVLAEVVGDAVVVGTGLNVSTTRAELPSAGATSLALAEAACTDRDPLLRAALRQLAADYIAWRAGGGDPGRLGEDYRARCDTLGRQVRVDLPGGAVVGGTASAVDDDGGLVVATGAGPVAVRAGDVVHLRTTP